MYAYFHKNKFLRFILNDDDGDKKRIIKALGHREQDVEIIKYNIALRNDDAFYFDENKDIVMVKSEEQDVVEEIENENGKIELVETKRIVQRPQGKIEKIDRERFQIVRDQTNEKPRNERN